MSDIYMNEVTGDLDLTNRTPRLTASTIEEVRQKVELRLRRLKGEWFANINLGVPYFQTILKKGVNKNLVDSILRKEITDTNGVIRITKFASEFNNQQRTYTATTTFTTAEGAVTITI